MSQQILRILKILHLLSSGRALTTNEIVDAITAHPDRKVVSQRQIQRDLAALEEAGVPLLCEAMGRTKVWSIPTSYRSLAPLSIAKNEVLSIYLLKGVLHAFRATRVERDVDTLLRKLERAAPGTVFMERDLVADISPGHFINTVSDEAFEKVIDAIVDPHWDRVTYRAMNARSSKTFVVSFCRLINHAGRLYVAAWHPKYKHYITLAVDAIEHVERASDVLDMLHVFSEGAFRRGRYGVYEGKQYNVVLRINKDAASFFMSREWHHTQQFRTLRNGTLELSMQAPITPELLSWVMAWAHELTVVKPQVLVEECRDRAKRVLGW